MPLLTCELTLKTQILTPIVQIISIFNNSHHWSPDLHQQSCLSLRRKPFSSVEDSNYVARRFDNTELTLQNPRFLMVDSISGAPSCAKNEFKIRNPNCQNCLQARRQSH